MGMTPFDRRAELILRILFMVIDIEWRSGRIECNAHLSELKTIEKFPADVYAEYVDIKTKLLGLNFDVPLLKYTNCISLFFPVPFNVLPKFSRHASFSRPR
jgi:hypothetical protein